MDAGAPRDRRAVAAVCAVAACVTLPWIVQQVTVPRLKEAAAAGVAGRALLGSVTPADWVLAALCVVAAAAVVVLEVRARAVSAILDRALDGDRAARRIVVVAVAGLALRAVFDAGVPATFDGKPQWTRVATVCDLIGAGEWPGWTWRSHGGFPILRFYGPLFYLVTGAVAACGLGALLALKTVLAGLHLLSAWFLGRFVREASGSARAGLAAALVFLLIPCRLHATLVLGRFPEAVLYAAFPALLWAAEVHVRRPGARTTAACAVAAACAVLGHPAVGAVLCIVGGVYAGLRLATLRPAGAWRSVAGGCAAAGIAAGLVAFAFLPGAAERPWVQLDRMGAPGVGALVPGDFRPGHWLALVRWDPLPARLTSVSYAGLSLLVLAAMGIAGPGRERARLAVPLAGAGLVAAVYVGGPYFSARAVPAFSAVVAAAAAMALATRGRIAWLLVLADLLPFTVLSPFRPGMQAVERDLAEMAQAHPGVRFVLLGERRGHIQASQWQTGGASRLPLVSGPCREEAGSLYPWHLVAQSMVEDDVSGARLLTAEDRVFLRVLGIGGVAVEDGRRARSAGDPLSPGRPLPPGGGTLPVVLARRVVVAGPAEVEAVRAPPLLLEAPADEAAKREWRDRAHAAFARFLDDPDAIPVVPGAPAAVAGPVAPAPASSGPVSAEVRCVSATDVRAEFEVETTEAAHALLAFTFHPGVRVRVDGVETTPAVAVTGQPVVPLAAGRHRIELTGPALPADRAGFLVSAAAAIAAAALVCAGRRRTAAGEPASR